MVKETDVNTRELNEIRKAYLEEFQDEETRHIYVNDFLNAKISTQIKVLREQKGWTQAELADKAGMKQERISALENVNYESWTISVLRRLAEAFDVRIDVSFEDFGSYLKEFSKLDRESLERDSFDDDKAFQPPKVVALPLLADENSAWAKVIKVYGSSGVQSPNEKVQIRLLDELPQMENPYSNQQVKVKNKKESSENSKDKESLYLPVSIINEIKPYLN